MKTITFNYTKKDGSTSERTLLALVTPGGDKYAGIDVSSLEPEQAAEFIVMTRELHEQYLDKLAELQARYDVKHNYRQFFADQMTNITEI